MVVVGCRVVLGETAFGAVCVCVGGSCVLFPCGARRVLEVNIWCF